MKRLSMLLFALMLCLVLAPAQADTIYKWTDEQGTVHYGERPPEGVNAELVRVTSVSAASAADDPYATARQALVEPSVAKEEREDKRKANEERRQEEARIAAACEAQKSRLEQLIPRAKVILQNPDGTSRMLDDDERLAMIDESQKFVDENCD